MCIALHVAHGTCTHVPASIISQPTEGPHVMVLPHTSMIRTLTPSVRAGCCCDSHQNEAFHWFLAAQSQCKWCSGSSRPCLVHSHTTSLYACATMILTIAVPCNHVWIEPELRVAVKHPLYQVVISWAVWCDCVERCQCEPTSNLQQSMSITSRCIIPSSSAWSCYSSLWIRLDVQP